MTDSAVRNEAAWIDAEKRALVDSTISDQWRAQLVRTLTAGLELPFAPDVHIILKFFPELEKKDAAQFLKDVMSAHIGVGVTQKMWRRILPVFWRLPAWGWSPAIQPPPPGLAMFRTTESLLSGGLHAYQSADGTRKEMIPVSNLEEHRK
jgi:hypothetical protein